MSDCLVRSRPKSEDITLSLLRRAKAAGFTALVITLDTNVLGWRTHDVDDAFSEVGCYVSCALLTAHDVLQTEFVAVPVDETVDVPRGTVLDRRSNSEWDSGRRIVVDSVPRNLCNSPGVQAS